MCRYLIRNLKLKKRNLTGVFQNVYAPEEDPELTVERYTRTFEQNDELGLNDMKVEGYQEEQL